MTLYRSWSRARNWRKTILLAIALVASLIAGIPIARYSHTTLLLLFTACIAVVAVWQSPYNGLLLIVILEVFRVQDALLTGGGWLTGAKSVGLLVLVVYLVQRAVRHSLDLRRTPLDVPLLVLVAVAAASSLWSADLRTAVDAVSSFVSLFGLCFLIVQLVTDEAKLARMIDLWIVATIALVVMQGANVGWGRLLNPDVAVVKRVGYAFRNPNGLAMWLMLVLGPVTARVLYAPRRIRGLVHLGIASILTYVLLLTGSRGAWVGAVVVFANLILERRRPSGEVTAPRHSAGAAVWRVFLVLVIVIIIVFSWSGLVERARRILQSELHLATRLNDIRVAWRIFLQNPLLGVGIGDYRESVDVVLRSSADIGRTPHGSHNLLLWALAQLGLVGFGALAWTILRVAQVARESSPVIRSQRVLTVFRGLRASLLGFAANSLFHSGLFFNILWITLGLFLASSLIGVEAPVSPRGHSAVGEDTAHSRESLDAQVT